MEKAVMSVRQLADEMGISLPKAYELVNQPDFPVLRVGTRILIPRETFTQWLIEHAKSHGNKDSY